MQDARIAYAVESEVHAAQGGLEPWVERHPLDRPSGPGASRTERATSGYSNALSDCRCRFDHREMRAGHKSDAQLPGVQNRARRWFDRVAPMIAPNVSENVCSDSLYSAFSFNAASY
jgi:hypothetical protein